MVLRRRYLITAVTVLSFMISGCSSYNFKQNVAEATQVVTEIETREIVSKVYGDASVEVSISRNEVSESELGVLERTAAAVTQTVGVEEKIERSTSNVIEVQTNAALAYPSGGYTLQSGFVGTAYGVLNSILGTSYSSGSYMEEANIYAANMAYRGSTMATQNAEYKLYSGQGSSVSEEKIYSVINNICSRYSLSGYTDISIGVASSGSGELFIAVLVR